MPRKSVARKAKKVPAVVIAASTTPPSVDRIIVRTAAGISAPRLRSST